MVLFSAIPFLNNLTQELPLFAKNLTLLANKLSLYLDAYQTDHISLRCHDLALAEQWRNGLSQCGECISDNMINGRPIYLFKLASPLTLLGQQISIVELPYPTDKKYQYQGWEHIEQVINVAPEKLVEKVMTLLPHPLPEGIKIKISEPKAEKERLPNPTVAITDGIVTIKYHPYSLLKIVESEC
ncbi:VOC family protein [Proteus mirabilis]|uniref:VOC family protein n=1 Tax=Proteus mirabilis TaxID=584 RepID=UPI00234A6078|nr:VOC family protein [Proteus mirabilis]MDC6122683.1 VOC family protein [Proteus mirabilis]MDC6136403.1 VOC family protein [Proteus mirabilis]